MKRLKFDKIFILYDFILIYLKKSKKSNEINKIINLKYLNNRQLSKL